MSSNITRLWQAIKASGQGVYQPALARQQLTVVSVETDSNGAVTAARGTIGGAGDFSVPVRGAGVRVGMLIGVTQPAHDPAAPLTFDGIDSTDDPSAGFSADDDADLPVPAWAGTPLTTAIEASPGRISSRITAHFLPVSAKYKPIGYLVFYSLDAGTTWITMTTIDDDGSTAYAVPLSRSFEPGTSVEVKLRAVFKSGARSIASSTHTITAAADTTTPGDAASVTIDNTVAGQLICTAMPGTIDASLFKTWRYEFSTSATGPFSAFVLSAGQALFVGAVGTWYVRVAPQSKSDVVGTYTAWTATTITAAAAPLDTTPPPAFGAPTLTQRSVTDANGTIRYFVKVTLPAYSFPADYFETEVSMSDGTNPPILAHITGTGTIGEWVMVPGTWTIGLRGVDQVGNRQSSFGTTAAITITPIGTPATMSAPAVTAKAGAMLIEWTRPVDAEWIRVTRATSAGGAGATVLGTFKSTAFLDILLTNGDVSGGYPTWYYATTAINLDGSGAIRAGTISSYTGAVVLATHGSWLGADTITAREILANTITANEIAATLTITGNTIRTAASGARVELDGPNNRLGIYGASALLAYLNGTDLRFLRDGNTAHPRSKFNETGVYVYNDSDVLRLQLDKDGLITYNNAGVAQFTAAVDGSGNGYTSLVLTNAQFERWGWLQAANDYQTSFLTRVMSGGVNLGTGILGYHMTPGGAANHRFFVGSSDYPLDQTTNYVAATSVEFNGGSIVAGADIFVGGVLWLGTYDLRSMNGGYGAGFDTHNRAFQARDIYAVRDAGATGIMFFGDQSGGARYVYYNGTDYIMPGANLVLNGVTVTSDRKGKASIRSIEAVGATFDQLRVTRYTHKDDPTGRERIGLVADEVAALYPEAVIESGAHDPADEASDGGQAVDLYALVSLTTAALQETRAELAALRADVAALKTRPR